MRRSLLGKGVALAIVSVLASPTLAGDASMRTKPDATSVGIWKAYVPHGVKGELDSYALD